MCYHYQRGQAQGLPTTRREHIMAKAIIKGYGKVDFDLANYDNNTFDFYSVALLDKYDEITEELHFIDEADFRQTLSEYPEPFCECEEVREFEAVCNGESYGVEACVTVAYVYEHTVMLNGQPCHFDAAVNLMDDELREKLHAEGIEDAQVFLDAYCKLHAEKYGEQFTI